MTRTGHICGLYYRIDHAPHRQYLPQVFLAVHSQIQSYSSRTVLKQTFINQHTDTAPEVRYTFPLPDGASVVGFTCIINKTRVIKGVVQERQQAKKTYDDAVSQGKTAGLFEQMPSASDLFTTTLGNIPAGATIEVELTYVSELKHDAEVDGIRFTIPTKIAPRYNGKYAGYNLRDTPVNMRRGIEIVVDVEMAAGTGIRSIQSPSHPIAVSIGTTSTAPTAELGLHKASATLSLGSAELESSFIMQIVATDTSKPVALLETHPTMPYQRALMTTLVPKFNLPAARPEIVFICDRSGSMGDRGKMENLKAALQLFLKSLPLGVKFNICSFGSNHSFLFERSRSYDADSLREASQHVSGFSANFGGTEMRGPVEETFKRRYKDMDLEVFLLTDGQIWDQEGLFHIINHHIDLSKGAIRLFSLGVGQDASHSLIEGVARAGNGFAQSVADNEKMNSKVMRMLKAAITPHVHDYTLEVAYEKDVDDDEFELVDRAVDALKLDVSESEQKAPADKKPISLFDESVDMDMDTEPAGTTGEAKFAHLPTVPEPTILQTPFKIPPLFAFNRTTVYLLLSVDSRKGTPKSVILRGTSSHGPLMLEIPVTALPERGETLHQLAAHKAVQELEEGRGWLTHARDAKDDALLKDKYDGRFADMVERAAVSLGVRFQVGGRWCSFVAVDQTGETVKQTQVQEEAKEEPEARGGMLGNVRFQRMAMSGTPAPSFAHAPVAMAMSARAMPAMPSAQSRRFRSALAVMPSGSALNAMPRGPPVMMQMQPAPSTDQFRMRRGLGGGSAPPGAVIRHRKIMAASEAQKEEQEEEDFGSAMDEEADLIDYSDEEKVPAPPPRQPTDLLEDIYTRQSFAGSWTWSRDLLSTLSLDAKLIAVEARKLGLGDLVGTEGLATALVLVYLPRHLPSRKEEWELLAAKAEDWLAASGQMGGMDVKEFLALVDRLMLAVTVASGIYA